MVWGGGGGHVFGGDGLEGGDRYFTMIKVTPKWVKGKQPIPLTDFDNPQKAST